MNHSSRRRNWALPLVGLAAMVSPACKKGPTEPVQIEVHGPDENLPWPQSVDEDVEQVVVRTFRRYSNVQTEVSDWNDRRARMSGIEYGEDNWVIFEALDFDGATLASGATQWFDFEEGANLGTIHILTAREEVFTPAFYFDDEEGSSTRAQFDAGQGRAGHTFTWMGRNQPYVVVGGADMVSSGGGIGGTPILGLLGGIEFYDPYTGRYTTVLNADDCDSGGDCSELTLENPRAFHTATLLRDGTVLIVGGLVQEGTSLGATATVELLIPSGDGVSATLYSLRASDEALVTARAFHTATAIHDDRVVVVGGMSGTISAPSFPATVEEYRLSDGYFNETGVELRESRMMHGTVNIRTNQHGLVVTGGRDSDSVVGSTEVIFLNEDLDLQLDVPVETELTTPRFAAGVAILQLPERDGEFMAVVGGYSSVGGSSILTGGSVSTRCEIYSPGDAGFDSELANSLSVGRAWPFIASLPISGELLVAGGFGSEGTPLASAERMYHEETSVWYSVEGSLPSPLVFAAGETLSSQFVLLTGGWNGTGSVSSSLFFNSGDYMFLPD